MRYFLSKDKDVKASYNLFRDAYLNDIMIFVKRCPRTEQDVLRTDRRPMPRMQSVIKYYLLTVIGPLS